MLGRDRPSGVVRDHSAIPDPLGRIPRWAASPSACRPEPDSEHRCEPAGGSGASPVAFVRECPPALEGLVEPVFGRCSLVEERSQAVTPAVVGGFRVGVRELGVVPQVVPDPAGRDVGCEYRCGHRSTDTDQGDCCGHGQRSGSRHGLLHPLSVVAVRRAMRGWSGPTGAAIVGRTTRVRRVVHRVSVAVSDAASARDVDRVMRYTR